ncbi:DUF6515 family protein [Aquimarina sp. M1]
MRTLSKMFVLGFLLSTVTISCTTTVRVRPTNRVMITKVHRPKIVFHNNVKYYRSDGVWYVKKNRRYVTVAAPVGLRVNTLPAGYRVITVRGARYYRHKGVYYKRSGRTYLIVQV